MEDRLKRDSEEQEMRRKRELDSRKRDLDLQVLSTQEQITSAVLFLFFIQIASSVSTLTLLDYDLCEFPVPVLGKKSEQFPMRSSVDRLRIHLEKTENSKSDFEGAWGFDDWEGAFGQAAEEFEGAAGSEQ